MVLSCPLLLFDDDDDDAKKATVAKANPIKVEAAYSRVEYETLSNQYDAEALTSNPVTQRTQTHTNTNAYK